MRALFCVPNRTRCPKKNHRYQHAQLGAERRTQHAGKTAREGVGSFTILHGDSKSWLVEQDGNLKRSLSVSLERRIAHACGIKAEG